MATIRFIDQNLEVEVPLGTSVLAAAQKIGAPEGSACGGVCACSTCHVIVREGYNSCNEPNEPEEDMLENAPGLKPTSRLSCQAVPDGSEDLVVEIPEWNRNLVKEPPH